MHCLNVSAGRRVSRAALWGLVGLMAFEGSAYARVSISGTPPTTVTAGTAYSFTPTASDTRSYTIRFSISNKPAWASFSTTTGTLSGTPAAANVGTYSNIVIKARDGHTNASLAPFSITVTAAANTNTPPNISGSPPTSVNAGSAYSFTPTASDANGDPLTFSVQNKPAWASFNATSGQLYGTPAAANVGSYSNIIISVSDGQASTSLAPFSISVNQVSSGSVTLNWTPPTTYSDGTSLTDLAGYKIYYGTASNNLNQTVQLSNAGLASYTLSNLSTGTWYFGVSAYTSGGSESVMSNVATKTIQ